MNAAKDAASVQAFDRGVEAALRERRNRRPHDDTYCEHVTTAATLVRVALGDAPADVKVPAELAHGAIVDALNDLRRAYISEVESTADSEAVRMVAHVLRVIDDLAESHTRGDPLPGRSDGITRERAAMSGMLELESQFARHVARDNPLNPIVALAHDMRSPLTSILFLVESLRTNDKLDEMQDRQLALVYSAAFGLSSMINDVLLLARGEIGDGRETTFSVSELMRSIRQIVEPVAEEKGLIIILEYPAFDWRVGLPVMLSRVVLNLVTNALKFTQRGSVTVTARELDETRVEFSVRDTGPGIPPAVLPSLLDAFRRLPHEDGRGRQYVFSSAGLGLSICQTMLRAMQSQLRVESQHGDGTRFSFEVYLPRAKDRPASP